MLTLLRGVYLHLLFLPALLSAPLCLGLGVGREAWLLLMRWTLERAGPVRVPVLRPGSLGMAHGTYGRLHGPVFAAALSGGAADGRGCCLPIWNA